MGAIAANGPLSIRFKSDETIQFQDLKLGPPRGKGRVPELNDERLEESRKEVKLFSVECNPV